MIVNIINNYRETREFVFLENYAGIAIYQANNPFAKTDEYHSGRAKEFVSEEDTRFWDIFNDETLTCGQRNNIYKSMASEYIQTHLKRVLMNAWVRIKDLFWKRWGGYSRIAIIAVILAAVTKCRIFWIGTVFYLIALTTGFGLNIARYSVYIFPFYLISTFWLSAFFLNQVSFINRQEALM